MRTIAGAVAARGDQQSDRQREHEGELSRSGVRPPRVWWRISALQRPPEPYGDAMVQWCRGVVVAGLAAVVGMVLSLPASADSATWSDLTGEVGGSSAIDILSHGVALDASGLTLTIRFATVDWAVVDQTPILVFLDVPGTRSTCCRRGLDNWTTLRENPWPPGGVSNLCYDLHRTPSAEALVLSVPASCIDAPTQVSWADPRRQRLRRRRPVPVALHALGRQRPAVRTDRPRAPRCSGSGAQGLDNAHFYSTNESEINAVFTDPNWRSEGANFSAIAFDFTGCPDEPGVPVLVRPVPLPLLHAERRRARPPDQLRPSVALRAGRLLRLPRRAARHHAAYRFWGPVFGKTSTPPTVLRRTRSGPPTATGRSRAPRTTSS